MNHIQDYHKSRAISNTTKAEGMHQTYVPSKSISSSNALLVVLNAKGDTRVSIETTLTVRPMPKASTEELKKNVTKAAVVMTFILYQFRSR